MEAVRETEGDQVELAAAELDEIYQADPLLGQLFEAYCFLCDRICLSRRCMSKADNDNRLLPYEREEFFNAWYRDKHKLERYEQIVGDPLDSRLENPEIKQAWWTVGMAFNALGSAEYSLKGSFGRYAKPLLDDHALGLAYMESRIAFRRAFYEAYQLVVNQADAPEAAGRLRDRLTDYVAGIVASAGSN